MRRYPYLTAFAALFSCFAGRASAATPTSSTLSAEQVAQQVQAFYDQVNTLATDFSQTYYHQTYRRTDKSNGKVVFSKPGKMRWDYAAPNNKKIISDGRRLLVYEPGEGKEKGQFIDTSLRNTELPQALSFLLGTGKIQQQFKPNLLDANKYGFPQGHVLELLPHKPNPSYARIVFYVDKAPERVGVVHRVLILDAEGNRNRFDFRNMRFNRRLPPATFRWQPPLGTERIVK